MCEIQRYQHIKNKQKAKNKIKPPKINKKHFRNKHLKKNKRKKIIIICLY